MVTKPFSKKLHADNDLTAREVVMGLLRTSNVGCKSNPDIYGVDVLLDDGNNLELERRKNWQTGYFPYDSIHIPSRKLKFLAEGNCHYALVCYDLSTVGFIYKTTLKEYCQKELVTVPNKYVSEGEQFIRVPTRLCHFIDVATASRVFREINQ